MAGRDGTAGLRARSRRRLVVAVVAALVVVLPLAWLWWSSLEPAAYPVVAVAGAHGHGAAPAGAATSVPRLTADRRRPADVRARLVLRQGPVKLASGRTITGFSVNGTTPGPTIRGVEGQLLEVDVVNASVAEGAAVHWHGIDVPNAEDGVAGVTQDAIPVGGHHRYRFVLTAAGTYWYHSHQVSHAQVRGGLLGALVVAPRSGDAPRSANGTRVDRPAPAPGPSPAVRETEVTAVVHTYAGRRTVNGRSGDVHVPAPAGAPVRIRVVNTDDGLLPVWVTGSRYRLLAIDGTDVVSPGLTSGFVRVPAGGRVDLSVTAPAAGAGARVELGGGAVTLGVPIARSSRPARGVDPLHYGSLAPLGFDVAAADRWIEYTVGRRPGFVRGRPGLWWTVNGRTFPDAPVLSVARGEVVRMTIANRSGEAHPVHLHGHHVVVLSRNGSPATGSPWWVDTLEVGHGESYEVAFRADNPGIWMDHCHNLRHAAEGLVAHLVYEGITSPHLVGGLHGNRPE